MPKQTIEVQVRPEWIDEYGHLNYRKADELLEVGQDHLMLNWVTPFAQIEQLFGLRSFVRRKEVDYKGQIQRDVSVKLETETTLGNSSLTFTQKVTFQDRVVIEAKLVVVFVDRDGVKTSLPDELRVKLE